MSSMMSMRVVSCRPIVYPYVIMHLSSLLLTSKIRANNSHLKIAAWIREIKTRILTLYKDIQESDS